jgi:hypothetical protein
MIPMNATIGAAAGWTISHDRRPARPSDPHLGNTVVAITMTKGSDTQEIAALADHGDTGLIARQIGLAVLAALAIQAGA